MRGLPPNTPTEQIQSSFRDFSIFVLFPRHCASLRAGPITVAPPFVLQGEPALTASGGWGWKLEAGHGEAHGQNATLPFLRQGKKGWRYRFWRLGARGWMLEMASATVINRALCR